MICLALVFCWIGFYWWPLYTFIWAWFYFLDHLWICSPMEILNAKGFYIGKKKKSFLFNFNLTVILKFLFVHKIILDHF